MNKMKEYIEDLLCMEIDGEITEEYILAAIERCEEILMELDDAGVYETMKKLEALLYF